MSVTAKQEGAYAAKLDSAGGQLTICPHSVGPESCGHWHTGYTHAWFQLQGLLEDE